MKSGEIRVENVTFGYEKGSVVVDDVHFHVEEGSFVTLVGPNGGGKTTVIKLILGLLQPQKGYVTVYGSPPGESRGLVGYVPQRAHLDEGFPIGVMEVVLMGRLPKSMKGVSAADRAAVESALEMVELPGYGERDYSSLSGGQRQRVLIARAIVSKPRILIMDEPTNNIDVSGQGRLQKLMKQLNRDLTIVVVSHDIGFVSEQVDKLVYINRTATIHPISRFDESFYQSLFARDGFQMVNYEEQELEECHG